MEPGSEPARGLARESALAATRFSLPEPSPQATWSRSVFTGAIRRSSSRIVISSADDRHRSVPYRVRVRILLLNQTFYPDVASTAQHLSELALELVKRGHTVTVVTGRQAYYNRQVLFARRENWSGVDIHRVYSTGYCRKTKWRRVMDFVSFIVSCCVRLATMPRHDVVVALTTPPLIAFIGAWRARSWRSRFCYWVMDFNPDEAIAAGWLRADSAPARILESMSRFALRQADSVIALDRFLKDRIVAKEIAPEKIAVIPPWSHDDTVRFDALGRKEFRKMHALENKFVVMYLGKSQSNPSTGHVASRRGNATGRL